MRIGSSLKRLLIYLISFLVQVFPAWTQTSSLQLLWKVKTDQILYTAPTVVDLEGDGRSEIILAGMNALIVLDGEGRELWRWTITERFHAYPSVLLRKNDVSLIYASDDVGNLSCLDAKGKLVWQRKLKGPCTWSAAPLADLDGDSTPELVQGDGSGTVWAMDASQARCTGRRPSRAPSPAVPPWGIFQEMGTLRSSWQRKRAFSLFWTRRATFLGPLIWNANSIRRQ